MAQGMFFRYSIHRNYQSLEMHYQCHGQAALTVTKHIYIYIYFFYVFVPDPIPRCVTLGKSLDVSVILSRLPYVRREI